jgi:AraC-like DNA-binding protein
MKKMDNIPIFAKVGKPFRVMEEYRAMERKKEGFQGQRMIVLPHSVVHKLEGDPITAPIHATDIGYYPEALHHFRERKNGCKQHILIFCSAGKGWLKLKGKRYEVTPDQYLVLPPNVHHSYGADEEDPWSIYWAHFSGSNAVHFSRKLNVLNTIPSTSLAAADYRIQLFDEIYHTLDNGYSMDNLQYASMCLWHFLSSFLFVNHFRHVPHDETRDVIHQTIAFFRNDLSRSLALKDLSAKFGYSISHFSFLFRSKTGYAPLEYLERLRIQRACQYLDLTDKRIKEIATLVGYEDQYYFSRVFRKIMGISARKYRESGNG